MNTLQTKMHKRYARTAIVLAAAAALSACSYLDDDEDNDAPTISQIAKQTVLVDNATGALSFTVMDDDDAAANLQVLAVSSDSTLLPSTGLQLSGEGSERTITLTPASNQSGSATVTLTVIDSDGARTEMQFMLDVNRSAGSVALTRELYGKTAESTPLQVGNAELTLDSEDPHAFDDLLAQP